MRYIIVMKNGCVVRRLVRRLPNDGIAGLGLGDGCELALAPDPGGGVLLLVVDLEVAYLVDVGGSVSIRWVRYSVADVEEVGLVVEEGTRPGEDLQITVCEVALLAFVWR